MSLIVSRAHLVPLALAFLAGLLAGFHQIGLAALCLGAGLCAALRGVPRNVLLCVVAGIALGIIEAQFSLTAEAPLSDFKTSRFAATLVDARALDDEQDAVTLRLANGSFASPSCRYRYRRSGHD